MSSTNKIIDDEYDDPRRDFLVKLLSSGAFVAGVGSTLLQPAYAGFFGSTPKKMPQGRSFFEIKGTVTVDGKPANDRTFLKGNEVIKTGNNSQAIFVVGKDAFILRGKSELRLRADNLLIDAMRLVTGRLLSVFGTRGPKQKALRLQTAVATIGIRGTGVYCETEQDKTYLCTCYGETNIVANNDSKSQVNIATSHHDAPKYILKDAPEGKKIVAAPMINHTDLELLLIEELVGRTPEFANALQGYSSPRRSY